MAVCYARTEVAAQTGFEPATPRSTVGRSGRLELLRRGQTPWSGRQDLNLRPPGSEPGALTAALHPVDPESGVEPDPAVYETTARPHELHRSSRRPKDRTPLDRVWNPAWTQPVACRAIDRT